MDGTSRAALAEVVKPRQRFGYDLMVHVGLSRYLQRQQRDEICQSLFEERGIKISAASVSQLCDRFLSYLEALHTKRAPELRAAMREGYPMHMDATCEAGKGGLFIVMDGWRGWILAADRIPAEHQDHLRPVVDRAVRLLGDPVACVRDLGDAGAHACSSLRERGIPDLVCHYHFLGAVGKKLFDGLYGRLRKALRTTGVRRDLYSLLRELRRYRKSPDYEGRFRRGAVHEELLAEVYWLLHGEGKKDLPFPLPHRDFMHRCGGGLEARIEQWVPARRSRAEHRALKRLKGLTRRVTSDSRMVTAT